MSAAAARIFDASVTLLHRKSYSLFYLNDFGPTASVLSGPV
ncbi:MAG: hypothetical protein AAFQ11_12335 [Pseudomonadota bacterium]